MKNVLLLVALMLVMSSLGWAGACGTATMATYDAPGFSCTIVDKTFSNFAYSDSAFGGASAVPDSGVNVIPCNGNTGASQCVLYMPAGEEGFVFTAPWSATSVAGVGAGSDSAIGYKITTTGGVVDALNLFAGFGYTGTGLVTVAETGSAFAGSLSLADPTGTPSFTSVTFAPVSSMTVTKDIQVNSGTNGSAFLSVVENGWSQVPEPRTVALFAVGLLGLVGAARRRLLKKS